MKAPLFLQRLELHDYIFYKKSESKIWEVPVIPPAKNLQRSESVPQTLSMVSYQIIYNPKDGRSLLLIK